MTSGGGAWRGGGMTWTNQNAVLYSRLHYGRLEEELLAGYDLDVIHVPSTSNQAADSLPRNAASQPKQKGTELPEREIPPRFRKSR
ncbi:hypothetical protein J6590_015825 [Homalodisca vitripennis]|nr:hypothetical protein J6590_015825 [Homalodisca vitripennis]